MKNLAENINNLYMNKLDHKLSDLIPTSGVITNQETLFMEKQICNKLVKEIFSHKFDEKFNHCSDLAIQNDFMTELNSLHTIKSNYRQSNPSLNLFKND